MNIDEEIGRHLQALIVSNNKSITTNNNTGELVNVIARLAYMRELEVIKKFKKLIDEGHVPLFVRLTIAILKRNLIHIQRDSTIILPFLWEAFCDILQAYHTVKEQTESQKTANNEDEEPESLDGMIQALIVFENMILDMFACLSAIDRGRVFNLYFEVLERSALKPSKLRVWLLLAKGFNLIASNNDKSGQHNPVELWAFAERFILRFAGKFKSVHGASLKEAVCTVFEWHADALNEHLQMNPVPAHFSTSIQQTVWPLLQRMHSKTKYAISALLAMASLITLTSKEFFWLHLDQLLQSIISAIRNEDVLATKGFLKLSQLIWIYLNKHREAWATMGNNVEELGRLLLFSGPMTDFCSRLMHKEQDVPIIAFFTIVFMRLPRMILNSLILKRLQSVSGEDGNFDSCVCWFLIKCLKNFIHFHSHRRYYHKFPSNIDDYYYYCTQNMKQPNGGGSSSTLVEFEYFTDTRDFTQTIQHALVKAFISLIQECWITHYIDPREETRIDANSNLTIIQKGMLREVLTFPIQLLPTSNDLDFFADSLSKLTAMHIFKDEKDLSWKNWSLERNMNHLQMYPALWLAVMHSHLKLMLTPLIEALPKGRTVHIANGISEIWSLKPANLEIPSVMSLLLRKVMVMTSLLVIPFEPTNFKDYYNCIIEKEISLFSESEFLSERLQRLYYFAIGCKTLSPECLLAMKMYLHRLLGQYQVPQPTKNERSQKSRKNSSNALTMSGSTTSIMDDLAIVDNQPSRNKGGWSLESLTSRLSLGSANSLTNLENGDLMSMWLIPLLEHDNSQLRHLALDLLIHSVPQRLHPHVLQCLQECAMLIRCSEGLRNVKYQPMKTAVKDNDLKIHLTTILTHLLKQSNLVKEKDNGGWKTYESTLVMICQQHLLEVFYFESEIDIDHGLTGLLSAFCRLVQITFQTLHNHSHNNNNTNNQVIRGGKEGGGVVGGFPQRLQVQLFQNLRDWHHHLHIDKYHRHNLSTMKQIEMDLVGTLFMLCTENLLIVQDHHQFNYESNDGNNNTSTNTTSSNGMRPAVLFSWLETMHPRYAEQVGHCLENLIKNVLKDYGNMPEAGMVLELALDKCYQYRMDTVAYWQALQSAFHQVDDNPLKIKEKDDKTQILMKPERLLLVDLLYKLNISIK